MFVTDYLKQQAIRTPDAIAIGFEGIETTYDQFYRNVECVAGVVQSQGFQKGDIIASMLLNSDLFMTVYYGVQLAGCTLLPINTKLAPEELTYIFNHSGAKGLFYDERLESLIAEVAYDFNWKCSRPHLKEALTSESVFQEVPQQTTDTAIVLYTSGTTGRPKGVMLSHMNIMSAVEQWAEVVDFYDTDRVYVALPLFHCAGLHVAAVTTLFSGATLMIAEMFIPNQVIPSIIEQKITVFSGVPTMYALLLSKFDFANQDFPLVRKMIYGAAPMPHEFVKVLKEAFPDVVFHNLYGQTESTPGATFLQDDAVLSKVGSVGRALPNTQLKIVNPDGEALPAGEVGEICLLGAQIMKGYLNNEEETKQTIKDGWLFTGDLGYLDEDGYLYLVDRKKDLIIRGGENIYPIEVEDVLYQIPQIVDAAVIGIPDEIYGEVPKAIVVLADNATLTEQEVVDYARTKLAKYKVPHVVEFVDQMPRNASGKILKHVLRDQVKNKVQ